MAISSALGGTIGAVPVGSVTAFAGATAPSGWLLCAGQNVSRTQYSGLFLTIGTTYGVGDGSTTFTLPDLRGRVVAGVDNMGGSTANRITSAVSGITGTTLGASGGTQEVPDHTHQHVSPVGLNNTGIRVYNPSHSTLDAVGSYNYNSVVSATQATMSASISDLVERYYVTSSNQSTKGTSQNVQPTMVMNYIIKAS
jgi:microcystin-dependent protein